MPHYESLQNVTSENHKNISQFRFNQSTIHTQRRLKPFLSTHKRTIQVSGPKPSVVHVCDSPVYEVFVTQPVEKKLKTSPHRSRMKHQKMIWANKSHEQQK